MRKLGIFLVAALAVTAVWFFTWRALMAGEVAQVKATIVHHADAIRAATPSANFKADAVYATGFPFAFRVAVERPTLTQIWGRESYAVSFEKIELSKKGGTDYRVIAPAYFEALYAAEGQAPERYSIAVNEMPQLLVRAVKEDAPLTYFAVQMPRKLVLDVAMGGRTQKIGFDFLSIPIPLFTPIPHQVSYPLQIFVGMLREAMLFRK